MASSRSVQKAACRGLTPWQAEAAVRLMSRDLCVDVPVEHLAMLCGLSRSYFIKAFKASLGEPPHRWLVRQRVSRAEALLEETDESISDIALCCGFADQSHLTRAFHAALGASPAAWRRRRRGEPKPAWNEAAPQGFP